jgi:hypothetical protein
MEKVVITERCLDLLKQFTQTLFVLSQHEHIDLSRLTLGAIDANIPDFAWMMGGSYRIHQDNIIPLLGRC